MHEIMITNKDVQTQTLRMFGMNLKLTLKFNNMLKSFQFDLFDIDKDDFIVKNCGLSVGSPSLIEKRLPFILTLIDESGQKSNPTTIEDYTNRISLVAMSMEDFRSQLKA